MYDLYVFYTRHLLREELVIIMLEDACERLDSSRSPWIDSGKSSIFKLGISLHILVRGAVSV